MVRCKEKANLKNGYSLDVRCDMNEGHEGQHQHCNYVDLEEGGECSIDIIWGEDSHQNNKEGTR